MPNTDLTITPILLTGGLNDSIGQPTPGDFQTLTNFDIYRDRLAIRAPITVLATINDVTISDILGVINHRGLIYILAYQATGANVRLYSLATDGTGLTFKTNVWSGVAQVPSPVMASFDGGSASSPTTRLYICDWNQNEITKHWDNDTTLTTEQDDFDDNNTAEDVKFNYIFNYNFHMFGAGFLQASANRPELLRVSQPGLIPATEPSVTFPTSREWFNVDQLPVGVRGQRIVSHGYAGGTAIILKSNAVYAMFGYDITTFTLKTLSEQIGAVGKRASCWTDNGLCFFWSTTGLNVTDGNTITPLSDPISSRVLKVVADNTVTLAYSPDDGNVYIGYTMTGETSPSRALAYNIKRGKFWEPEYVAGSRPNLSGMAGIPTFSLPGPSGAPTSLAGTVINDNEIDLTWVPADTAFDVTTEIYRDTTAGATTFLASVSGGTTNYQDTTVTHLTTYFYRLRHKRNGQFSSYSSEISKRTPCAEPTSLSAQSISTGIRVTLTNNEAGADVVIERAPNGGSFSTVTTLLAQTTGVKTFDDTTTTCDSQYQYRAKAHLAGETDSIYSNISSLVTACQNPHLNSASFSWNHGCHITISWSGSNLSGCTIKIFKNDDGGGFTQIDQVSATDLSYIDIWPWQDGATPRTIDYRLDLYQGTSLIQQLTIGQQSFNVQPKTCPF